MTSTSPFPGIQVHTTEHGFVVLRLHWSADPAKAKGEQTYVPEIKRSLSPWALKLYNAATDKSLFLQEYEIDASATLGQRVFQLDEEASLEPSFPIPPKWTRYFSIDPHRSVPWAMLWVAIDPWGDMWAYRELWPSKVCFRYEGGILMGKAGPVPDDDNRYRIKEYASTIYYLESDDSPSNKDGDQPFAEKIYERVIDYAARGFGLDVDDPAALNYQARLEKEAYDFAKERGLKWSLDFVDAKKDRGVGEEVVNGWLRPREVQTTGEIEFTRKAKLHIFADKCPELIYELKNNRRQQLSAVQAEKMDPTGKPIEIRKHMTDNLLYICAANPEYHVLRVVEDTYSPLVPGIAY